MPHRSYKYRFYPTECQRAQLEIEFGHARFVWNWALEMRTKAYRRRGESLNYVEISRRLTALKACRRYCWLSQGTANCSTQKLIDLDKAFGNFFEQRARYPRFRKKHARQSVRYQLDQRHVHRTFQAGKTLQLPKLGPLTLRWSRLPLGVPKMATVSRDAAGRYFVSLSVLEDIASKITTINAVGVDVGIKDIVVTSDGFRSGAPKSTYRHARRLRIEQRRMSRKRKGSGRWTRQKVRVAQVHARIRDTRNDFLHQLSTRLIDDNQVIAIEDLNVSGMLKNRRLSKAISDSAVSELRRQLTYKARWYGRELRVVSRFEPTSKRCNVCGDLNHSLTLGNRQWQCQLCGTRHDRDINAAKNILHTAGSAELKARGGCTTPARQAA
ncbi:MAG: RNA-guided endonuclease InsQ/TnpB family protein [Pseudomonadales bacterium]